MNPVGSVTLVGAGPGDPDLMTLAGRDALAAADVVFHDRLIGPEVLRFAAAGADLVPVGKNKGDHPVPQREINRLLLESALAGKRVVRLKGGDPYLFGRGAEELEMLRAHGVPFRVIPGITSALAAPAYAGIPVTHREHASSLHILTGHGKDGSPPPIPYRELTRLGGTLVFLMGLSSARDICRGLVDAGLPADTPAAAIEKGTRANQRRLVATVATLPDAVQREGFASPAILVVGAVCALAEDFDWTAHLPLWGRRVVCASAGTTASRLGARLRRLGADVREVAALVRTPLPQAEEFWAAAAGYDWVAVTSPYGAELLFAGLRAAGVDLRRFAGASFAAVGARTAGVLRDNGIVADYVPDTASAGALAAGLAARVAAGRRVLLFRARDGDPDLAAALRRAGAAVDDVAAYATSPAAGTAGRGLAERFAAGGVDAVTCTSASAVRSLAAALPGVDWAGVPCFCIGEATAAAVRDVGGRPVVAAEASLDAVAAAVVGHFSSAASEPLP